MRTIPDYMPVLSKGSHKSPAEGACIMEYASFIAGEKWSDTPACTHPVLAVTAQHINDMLGDEDRQLLLSLLPRLMGTSAGSGDRVLAVRLAVWAARQVTHLNPNPNASAAIAAAEAWCDTPDKAHADAAYAAQRTAADASDYSASGASAYATSAATYASDATYAATYATTYAATVAATSATTYAYAAIATYAATAADKIEFLSSLIDEYDRLTGRTEYPTVTEADLARCAELTN